MRKWEVDLTLIGTWMDCLDDEEYWGSPGAHIRVLFAFDIQSRAIMLVAGDKAGNWTKRYATNVPIADRPFTEHQQKMKQAAAATAAKSRTRKGKKR